MLAAAVAESLDVMRDEGWRRTHLADLIARLKSTMAESGAGLAPSDTPIQPLIVGSNAAALDLAGRLRERGILVPAIRPPTVPEGTARLRVSLSAAHSLEEVGQLALALAGLRQGQTAETFVHR